MLLTQKDSDAIDLAINTGTDKQTLTNIFHAVNESDVSDRLLSVVKESAKNGCLLASDATLIVSRFYRLSIVDAMKKLEWYE